MYRALGRTGEEVSILGFGCMRLPTVGGDEGRVNEDEATRLLHRAIELGVNLVDTAYGYHRGNSEPWLGRALMGGYRNKVYLATKLPSWQIQNRKDCDRYLDDQLRRLKTDCIDFYLLHSLRRDWWRNLENLGALEFLDSALREGKIRYAGFSFHDTFDIFTQIVDAYAWSFCLVQYNYMDTEVQAGTRGIEYAARRGLGVAVMEPLRGGKLVNNIPGEVEAIWTAAHWSPAEYALRWVWNHDDVSTVLSGMNSLDQLEENAAAASTAQPGNLLPEDLEVIRRVQESYRERLRVPCTECGYCIPCPQGVNIPKILSIYNDIFIYEDHSGPRASYNHFMSPGERALNCTDCGECEEICPQDIPIAKTLKVCHEALILQ